MRLSNKTGAEMKKKVSRLHIAETANKSSSLNEWRFLRGSVKDLFW